jgi:hypothetical protein
MSTLHRLSGIKEAIALADSQIKIAEELGVSKTTVQLWVKQGYVPLKYVEKLEELYGVERSRLCDPLILKVFPEILRKSDSEE